MFDRFMARQLARPRGLFGRFVMGSKLNRLNAVMNDLTLRQLATRPEEAVVEVGFGGGALIERLLETGAVVSGVELSTEMAGSLKRRLRAHVDAGKLDVHIASVEDLPFPDRSFDKACTVNTIYFWPDLAAGLHQLYRVLRPRGLLAVCFNPADELAKWPGHRHGFHLYSTEAVEEALEAAGFVEIATACRHDPEQGEIVCTSALRPA